MYKRLIVLAILLAVAVTASATDNTYDPHVLTFPFTGALTTTTGASSTTCVKIPAGIKITGCLVSCAGSAVAASTTGYLEMDLIDDGTVIARFTSSGTSLVQGTPATMTTPLTSSNQWIAKDSVLRGELNKVGGGVTATNAEIQIHYINVVK